MSLRFRWRVSPGAQRICRARAVPVRCRGLSPHCRRRVLRMRVMGTGAEGVAFEGECTGGEEARVVRTRGPWSQSVEPP